MVRPLVHPFLTKALVREFAVLIACLALTGCFDGRLTWVNLSGQTESPAVTGPNVTITTPAAGSYLNSTQVGAANFGGTCTEAGGAVTLSATGGATASATCSGGLWTVVGGFNLSAEAEGAVTITVAHSTATPASVTVTKDTAVSLPSILPSLPGAVNIQNAAAVPFNINCPENGSILITGSVSTSVACSAGSNSIGVDLSAVADGLVALTFGFQDVAGNTSSTVGWGPVTKDTVAPGDPSGFGFSPVSPIKVLSTTITGTAFSGTDTIKVYKDAACSILMTTGTGSGLAAGISIGLAADSTTPLYVREYDAVGNSSNCVLAHSGFVQDSTVPILSGAIDDGIIANTSTASPLISTSGVSASDSGGSGVFKLQYAIGTDPSSTNVSILGWTDNPVGSSFTATGLTGLISGSTYYVKMRAVDYAGNLSSVLVSDGWLFDNTPPVLTVVPAEFAAVSNPIYISGTCEDGLTINVSYNTHGFTGTTSATCSGSAYGVDATIEWLDGDYVVTVSETDAAGNPASVTRTLSYTMPSNSWVPINVTNAPGARLNHTAVWDNATQSMIVWGGEDAVGPLGDGAVYDLLADDWFPLASSGLAARSEHVGLWLGTHLFVWGGLDAALAVLGDGSVLDLSTSIWTATSSTSPPAARYGHDAVWTGADVMIWGGFDGGGNAITAGGGAKYNALAPTPAWSALASSGTPPTPRGYHKMAWASSTLVVWGGVEKDPALSVSPAYYNTGGRLNAGTWGAMATPGTLGGRIGHTMVTDGDSVYVWGGYDGSTFLGNGASYSVSGDSWTAITASSPPSARTWHSAVHAGPGNMIIWGGEDSTSYHNDGAIYTSGGAGSWIPITSSDPNTPTGRKLHAAVWTGTYMIIWGGHDGVGALGDGAIYKP